MEWEWLRCKFSKEGIEAGFQKPERFGWARKNGVSSCIILWDGRKSTTTFHKNFIEIIPYDRTVEIKNLSQQGAEG